MARLSVKNRLVDFDDLSAKRQFVAAAGVMRGVYNVTLEPKAPTRTLKQNAAFWSLLVEPLYQFLRDQEYAVIDREHAKRILCAKILGTEDMIDPTTGEVIETVAKGTSRLSTEDFASFYEKCQVYLAEMFDIVTLDPDPNYKDAAHARH